MFILITILHMNSKKNHIYDINISLSHTHPPMLPLISLNPPTNVTSGLTKHTYKCYLWSH